MKSLIGLLIVISAAVGLALLLRFNDGNIAILWPPYRVDVSLNLAIVLLLALFLLLYLVVRTVTQASGLPERVRRFRSARRQERASRALRDSVVALFEGRYGRAERLAETAHGEPALSGAAALLGARAAQAAREGVRRDRWLEMAESEEPARMAARMLSAELALEDERPEDALLAVEQLGKLRGGRLHALELRLQAYQQQKDWERLLGTLKALDKTDTVPEPQRRALKVRAYRALFKTRTGDAAAVKELWKSLGSAEREIGGIVEAAAQAFAASDEPAQAAKLAESALDKSPSSGLLALYARLDAVPAQQRLRTAERWLDKHGEDPDLLATLGQLCAAEQIWGKAEEFLVRAEQKGGSRQARLALATLYDTLDRPDEAAAVHRRIATDLQPLALPAAATDSKRA